MLQELLILADSLDSKGFHIEANQLDLLIKQAWEPMSPEELKQKEDEVRVRLRNQFRSEQDIEDILDIIFPQRVIQSSLRFAQEDRRIFQEEEGQETGLSTEQDPTRYDVGRIPLPHRDSRIIENIDGTLKCKDCGSIIPVEEKQLGCRVCEEEKNLGFLKTPDGTIHPPRLKNPPRIYDRYREELPEDIEMSNNK